MEERFKFASMAIYTSLRFHRLSSYIRIVFSNKIGITLHVVSHEVLQNCSTWNRNRGEVGILLDLSFCVSLRGVYKEKLPIGSSFFMDR